MADVFSKKKRSVIMSLIRGKNTAPDRGGILLVMLGACVQMIKFHVAMC